MRSIDPQSGALRERVHCAVNGCSNQGTQRHHAMYRGPRSWYEEPRPWARIWLCRPCHAALHDLEGRLRTEDRYVDLALLTLHFVLNAEQTIAMVRHQGEPKTEINAEQLSFADGLGPAGDYFRNWMLDNGYDAPPHRPWTEDEREAA